MHISLELFVSYGSRQVINRSASMGILCGTTLVNAEVVVEVAGVRFGGVEVEEVVFAYDGSE